jgi:mitochondrial fission protein ELM1
VEGNPVPRRQPQLNRRAIRARKKTTIVQILRPLIRQRFFDLFITILLKEEEFFVKNWLSSSDES